VTTGDLRTGRLRSFDPRAVGRWEAAAWVAYYRRDWAAFLVAAVRLTRAAADGAGRRGEGVVDGAVEGVARGARAVGRLARRPQTGQLHQYYAQAFTAFGVLVVVLLLLAR